MNKLIPLLLAALLALGACSQSSTINEASLDDFHQALAEPDTLVLDVRAGLELGDTMIFIDDAKQLPLATLEANLSKIPKEKNIFIVGGDNGQTTKAGNILAKAGFAHVNKVNGTLGEYVQKFGDAAKPYLK